MKFDSIKFIKDLISFKSVSTNKDCDLHTASCAKFLNDFFSSKGFTSQIVKTEKHPIVFAKKNCKGKPVARLLCYGHYDVQPEHPISKWHSDPFKAIITSNKIYGRGSADNKGPFTCLIAGFLNFIEKHPDANLDIAFLIEGEEEISSPSMPKFLKDFSKELSTYDAVLLSDTMSPSPNQIVINTGVRGMIAFDAKFKGPKEDLHSGLFGGAVYNPIQAMSEVCASLHDKDGLVNIPHFYDDVLPVFQWEKDEIEKFPISENEMLKNLEVKKLYSQKNVKFKEATRLYPTLEFNGIGGGYEDSGCKTIISSECFCKISCRLVANQDAEKIKKLVQEEMLKRCPESVELTFENHDSSAKYYFVIPPTKVENSPETPLKKLFECADKSVQEAFGNAPLYLRDGGSISLIAQIHDATKLDCLMTGLFTPEDNLHAPNESFSLEMLEKGSLFYELLFEKISK